MSGLLRRIKRSRAADAGEAPAEGQAAGPEGAPTTAETSGGDAIRADASDAETTELPAAAPAGEAADPGHAESPRRRRIGPRLPRLRRRRAPAGPPAAAPATQATAPLIRADPHTPAGLDPAATAVAPPSGRRGRLRRRLRYLRRARELMLRDLGGLLYEVHRTAGGDVTAHSTVIGAKVERLSRLDAESEAIEAALGAPRSEAVVFQPGVGGTCETCGELYGSAARFCSNCGAPTGAAARTTAGPAAEPRTVPAMPKPPGATAVPADTGPARGDDETPGDEAGAPGVPDETAGDETAAEAPTGETAAEAPTGETAVEAPTGETEVEAPAGEPAAEQPPEPGGEPRTPFSRLSNGRSEDRASPELSSGDPLSSRERP